MTLSILRFNLAEKDGEADRKVPLQPLAFLAKDGQVSRYNLRKVKLSVDWFWVTSSHIPLELNSNDSVLDSIRADFILLLSIVWWTSIPFGTGTKIGWFIPERFVSLSMASRKIIILPTSSCSIWFWRYLQQSWRSWDVQVCHSKDSGTNLKKN